MNKEQLALRIQELAQKYGINLDNTPDEFGRLPSERIAGFVTSIYNEWDGVDYAELGRKMAYISALNEGEEISITFNSLYVTGKDNAVIPSCYIGDDMKRAIIDSLYKSISRDLNIYVANKSTVECRRIDCPLYQDAGLWKKIRAHVENAASNTNDVSKALKQRQKMAVQYSWDFIPKDSNGEPEGCRKTVAASFIYDIIEDAGLIESTEPLTASGKWQRIKTYIKTYTK